MPTDIGSYAWEPLGAIPVDVVVDGDRVKVVDPETGRCRLSVRLGTTSPGVTEPSQVVNTRTSPLRNLAPADLKKDPNGFDLPIALGLLLASGQVAFDRPGNYAIVGELVLTDMP